jgi:hypothetical protein
MSLIIGISGWARAGKDTIADYLVKSHGFKKMSFADPMRESLLRLDPLVRTLEGNVVHLSQLVHTSGWELTKAITDDLRPLMQRLGTEVGREMFGTDFWVDLALSKIKKNEKIVIADCRFQNEANAIRKVSGQVWRVERPGYLAANDHISEHDLDNYTFDTIFPNNSEINNLESLVADYIK